MMTTLAMMRCHNRKSLCRRGFVGVLAVARAMTTTMEKSNANERFAKNFAWRSRERFWVGNRAKNYSAVAATKEEEGDVENGGAETKKKGGKTKKTFANAPPQKNKWAQTAAEAIPDPTTLLNYRCSENLSDAQANAVLSPNPSFVRVLAGPGSGKTHVLVSRVQHLIEDQNVLPENILCITFTNKAAKELRNRLEKAMGVGVSRAITAGTFHAVAARILRKHVGKLHEELQRTSDFSIYDSDDSKALIRDILVEKLGQTKKSAAPLPMKNFISAAKSSMKTSVNVNARTAMDSALRMKARGGNNNNGEDDGKKPSAMMTSSSSSGIALLREQFDIVWSEYEQKLREANSFDFDDLLSAVVYLFETRPDAKRYLQNRWSHVLVDEFQDTSLTQYEMIRHIGEKAETIFVVGDADQAIYGWRGAEVMNIRSRFEDDFRNAQTFRLTTNYRSTATIVSAARAVIQQSEIPSALMSWDAIKEGGQDVAVVEAGDEREEGAFIATQVKQMLKDAGKKTKSSNSGSSSSIDILEGLRKKDIAVLYRTNTQARALEEAFVRAGVPHVVVGDQSFYGRKEIKDLIAYLRVASNSSDGVSLRRIINTPSRGIGEKTVEKLEEWVSRCEAPSLGAALFDRAWATDADSNDPDNNILPSAKEMGITARARNSVLAFAKTLIQIRKTADTVTNPGEVLKKVIAMTDYENHIKDKDDANERWSHVAELIQLATDAEENLAENDIEGGGTYASKSPKTILSAFLEGVSLLSSSEATHGDEMFDDEEDESRKERADAVKLMTLHASKGAEFDVVFIAGCEDGFTPSARANESAEERDEEVRLFYVGVTRAKKKLFLCHANTRRRFGGKPEVRTRSPFVDAIAEALGQSGNSNILKPKVPKSAAKPARKNTSTFDWKKRIVVDVNENGEEKIVDDEKLRRLRRARQSVAKATGLDANSIEF